MIDALPGFPGFTIEEPGSGAAGARPPAADRTARRRPGSRGRSRTPTGWCRTSSTLGTPPTRYPVDLAPVGDAVVAGLDPAHTIPDFTMAGITIPARIVAINLEVFGEAMAYPEFDIPMYEPLLDLPGDNFLPNIDLIAPNTITLLETNQRFIEAYMVGLNDAMARELLWREYPTDQRGSYFRQFWDPSAAIDRTGLSKEAAAREAARHPADPHLVALLQARRPRPPRAARGDRGGGRARHPRRAAQEVPHRGDLCPARPLAAHRRRDRPQPAAGVRDRRSGGGPAADAALRGQGRPRHQLLRLRPHRRGGPGRHRRAGDDDPGWFFVIKERPGEPRFGLDLEADGALETWSDLAWPQVFDPATDHFLDVGAGTPTLTLTPPNPATASDYELLQHDEDVQIVWRPAMNAAELAYVLYQVPVLVAVHGAEMLPS